ncbi:2Fe-2S iron-sulfur cluster-binding protein [Lentzea sp. NPDC051838]|uniref:2Fe-2S iron-sulfur cluster-binding protein n=1 Tax=Lentzea sp. NPDC051838 TaxID=3154849 RepID=UPI003436322A
MTKIRVLPLDVEITVHSGESMMAAAQREGYFWPTRCRGQALCTACLFEVVSGDFDQAATLELEALESLSSFQARRPGLLRLGCQARPTGSATILKRGMKPADTERNPGWTVLPT